MDYQTTQEKARTTTDAVTESMERTASSMPASQAAAEISGSMERNWANEPVNSTARSVLMAGAGLAVLGSLVMQMTGRKHESLFMGQWAPTLLLVALWYQLVKGQRHGNMGMRP